MDEVCLGWVCEWREGRGWPWLLSAGFDQPGSGLITLALINKLRKHTGHDWAARVKKITGNLREAQDTHAFHSSLLNTKQPHTVHTRTHQKELAPCFSSSRQKSFCHSKSFFTPTVLLCLNVQCTKHWGNHIFSIVYHMAIHRGAPSWLFFLNFVDCNLACLKLTDHFGAALCGHTPTQIST